MAELEKSVEDKCVAIADARGVKSIKLNLQGRRGWPDRLFIAEYNRVWFVEFKRSGEKPNPLQAHIHRMLKRMGFRVSVFTTVSRFRRGLREWMGQA
jgi:hypothetical protein